MNFVLAVGCFFKYSTYTYIYICTITQSYEYMYAHSIPMSTSERLCDLILRFIKSVIKSVSLSMETSVTNERIISYKCNTGVKFRI
jgi:hypothetical protein